MRRIIGSPLGAWHTLNRLTVGDTKVNKGATFRQGTSQRETGCSPRKQRPGWRVVSLSFAQLGSLVRGDPCGQRGDRDVRLDARRLAFEVIDDEQRQRRPDRQVDSASSTGR
jgi:hypothetical protein